MARGGSSETAGAEISRRILPPSWSLHFPALGVRLLSRGGFVFLFCAFLALRRPRQSLAVSCLPGYPPPGVWVVIPAVCGGFALRSPYAFRQFRVYQPPQAHVGREKRQVEGHNAKPPRATGANTPTLDGAKLGKLTKPQRGTGIAAPTPEQYGPIRRVARCFINRFFRMGLLFSVAHARTNEVRNESRSESAIERIPNRQMNASKKNRRRITGPRYDERSNRRMSPFANEPANG